jgi:hypothetical protein
MIEDLWSRSLTGGARSRCLPEETVGLRFARPLALRLRGREIATQQRNGVDDSMQVNDDLTADPIDVVATFVAQRPGHRRQCARVGLLAVIFVRADVPILAEGAPHVTRGEKDRARALRAARSPPTVAPKTRT